MTLKLSEVPIQDASGSSVDLKEHASGTRVALYFTAGWCPMCTRFEPSLAQFRKQHGDITCVMVSSDRAAADANQRAADLGMLQVAYDGAFREALKRHFKVWSGSEAAQLGFGRRSGVPALVVLDEAGDELAFVDAERSGPASLKKWPEGGQWA